MTNDKVDEVIEEYFQSLLSRYQIGVQKTMTGSSFIFDHVHLLYYKCHKINLNRGGSYTDSLDWIKKAPINPINKNDNKRFQYAATLALNQNEYREDSGLLAKIKPFIHRYN